MDTEILCQRFRDRLTRSYVACMFDYDGTLVERGFSMPVPAYVPPVLRSVTQKAYMAVCSARPFENAVQHAQNLLGYDFESVRHRWLWFCENGGVGYAYNTDSEQYEEFYRVAWPTHIMPRDKFENLVTSLYEKEVQEIDFHESIIIVRPKNLETMSAEAVWEECDRLEVMGLKLLRDHGLEGEIRFGNSHLGVMFFNPTADKDRAVQEFGMYLKNHGVNIDEPYSEIACFGDQPGPHGNDEQFLSGRFGTPFTVGESISEKDALSSVCDSAGDVMYGPRATIYALENLSYHE